MSTYKPRRKFMLFTVFMAFVLVLAACGSQKTSESEGSNTTEKSTTEESTSKEQSTENERVIRHAMGATTVTGTPKRVVALTNGAADMAIALGVKPVGAVKHWGQDPWYDYLEEDMKGVEMVGMETQPDIEKIASLNPDLILASKIRHEKIADKLEAIAPTVYSQSVGMWKDELPLYAKAMNKTEKANEIMENWEKRVADFKEKMGDRLSETEVSIVRFMPGKVRIMHNGFSGAILDELGLARPESQQSDKFAVEATPEQIPDMDGDVIFHLTYETGDGKGLDTKKEWMNHPLWKNLNAVKNGKVYEVSDATWNSAGGVIAANKMLDDLYKYLLDEEK